jgi:hypothetical protein
MLQPSHMASWLRVRQLIETNVVVSIPVVRSRALLLILILLICGAFGAQWHYIASNKSRMGKIY